MSSLRWQLRLPAFQIPGTNNYSEHTPKFAPRSISNREERVRGPSWHSQKPNSALSAAIAASANTPRSRILGISLPKTDRNSIVHSLEFARCTPEFEGFMVGRHIFCEREISDSLVSMDAAVTPCTYHHSLRRSGRSCTRKSWGKPSRQPSRPVPRVRRSCRAELLASSLRYLDRPHSPTSAC